MIVEAGDWLTGHEANAGKHIKEAAGNTAQFAWKQRASRMYDLPTLDWPCPTRIWCICCLSTAYQSSIRSSHIASLRGAALEVIGWPTAIHCSLRLLHLSDFCHQATERSRFPTQRCSWKWKCSKVSHFTNPCWTCSRFYFFRGTTNRQSEQLLGLATRPSIARWQFQNSFFFC